MLSRKRLRRGSKVRLSKEDSKRSTIHKIGIEATTRIAINTTEKSL